MFSARQISLEEPVGNLSFAAIDFETTGAVRGYASLPWQVGIVCIKNKRIVLNESAGLDTFLRIPLTHRFNQHTPGNYAEIRPELASAPNFSDTWQYKINPLLSANLCVAHNIGTERSLLRRFAPLTNYNPWIDTLKLAKRIYPNLESYALEDLIKRLDLSAILQEIVPGRTAHDAFFDAAACAILLIHFLNLPNWENACLGDIIA